MFRRSQSFMESSPGENTSILPSLLLLSPSTVLEKCVQMESNFLPWKTSFECGIETKVPGLTYQRSYHWGIMMECLRKLYANVSHYTWQINSRSKEHWLTSSWGKYIAIIRESQTWNVTSVSVSILDQKCWMNLGEKNADLRNIMLKLDASLFWSLTIHGICIIEYIFTYKRFLGVPHMNGSILRKKETIQFLWWKEVGSCLNLEINPA
jgi:hypothetical protein